jgi:hypothetical protein
MMMMMMTVVLFGPGVGKFLINYLSASFTGTQHRYLRLVTEDVNQASGFLQRQLPAVITVAIVTDLCFLVSGMFITLL